MRAGCRYRFLAAAATLGAVPVAADQTELIATGMAISAPRVAVADVEGNGNYEVVVAGRVGAFLPATTPAGRHTSRVEVWSSSFSSDSQSPFASLAVAAPIRDVTAADLDGDGRDEIIAAAGAELLIFTLQNGRLLERQRLYASASAASIHRVACVASGTDHRVDVAWAESSTAFEAESPGSVVRLAKLVSSSHAGMVSTAIQVESSFAVRAHVGDLCLRASGAAGTLQLAIELGLEETGGRVHVYDVVNGLSRFRVAVQGTPEQRRIIALDAVPGSAGLLMAATVDGAGYLLSPGVSTHPLGSWRVGMDRGSLLYGICPLSRAGVLRVLVGCSEPSRGSGALLRQVVSVR